MEWLKWVSYGTWDNVISQDDYGIVKAFAIVFLVLVILKTFFLTIAKDDQQLKSGNPWGRFFLLIARVLQGVFYLLLYPILGLFESPGLFFIVLAIGAYFIVMAVMSMSDDYDDHYVWDINGRIKDQCEKWGLVIKEKKTRESDFNKINKTINDYRKKAVIG